jgi:uncharacterized OB-fold protein
MDAYFTGLAAGRLVAERCQACSRLQFPLEGRCAGCGDGDPLIEVLSGEGVVYSYAVQPGRAAESAEVVLALVEAVEQPGLRYLGLLVDLEAGDLAPGMPLAFRPGDTDAAMVAEWGPAGGWDVT